MVSISTIMAQIRIIEEQKRNPPKPQSAKTALNSDYWKNNPYWRDVQHLQQTGLSRQQAISKADASLPYARERMEHEGKKAYNWQEFWSKHGHMTPKERKQKLNTIQQEHVMVSY